jgi:sulfur carrier protein
MIVTVNGSERDVPDVMSLLALIRSLQLPETTTVAEVCGTIIPSDRFADTLLRPHDRIELIRFVGGG